MDPWHTRASGKAGWSAAIGALAAAAVGTAALVEYRSRRAERAYPAPGRFIHIGGVRLHYRLQGEGPPVVLLHGNLVHGEEFEASGLVERLARNHRVLVLDRPGFGWSDRPRGTSWTPAAQARLLHRAAAALGMHRAVVVGHSLGAQVAVAMALQEPADVAGLVLIGGYFYPGLRLDALMASPGAVPLLGDALRYTVGSLAARATLGHALARMFAPQPLPRAFERELPRELLLRPLQQRATAEDAAHMVPQARALCAHYAQLRMPVTLIAGEDDRVVDARTQSERMHLDRPNGELHLLPGAGHMVHWLALDHIAQAVDAMTPTALKPRVAEAPAAGGANVVPLRADDGLLPDAG